ncbi:MAG: gamma-glutamylcyclotransferase [Rhodospirillaceae bacterium]|nr:MAG: gamma-glutamylcyclotransferase [Rhodospirillaceae bacterium]
MSLDPSMTNEDSPPDLWVFGYGSLMWNPGFRYKEKLSGQIDGFHRSLCILSTSYRGTPDNPGLVLGLDEGGTCEGLAFCIAPENIEAAITYLDDREQINQVYCPVHVDVALEDGRVINACTFVARKSHDQYVNFPIDKQAQLVARGHGDRGSALDYLSSTIERFDNFGFDEQELRTILAKAQNA